MRLLGDDGRPLAANLSVAERPDGTFELVMDSAGGRSEGGKSRNPDYPAALELALRRLGVVGARLLDAAVVSKVTAALTADERRVRPEPWTLPVELSTVTDFPSLRKALTRPQRLIGSSGSKGGNERKRLALILEFVPALPGPEAVVSSLGVEPPTSPVRHADHADGLSAERILEAIAEWDSMGREGFLAAYEVFGPQRYVLVHNSREYDAKALLQGAARRAGTWRTDARYRGDARTVAEPLRRMGFVVESVNEAEGAPDGLDERGLAELLASFTGETDAEGVLRAARREQRLLRRALGLGPGRPEKLAECGLCGTSLPRAMLVAAHIKPRSKCTEVERLDMPHVAMAACALGCDCRASDLVAGPVACGPDLRRSLIDHGEAAGVPG